MSDIVAVLGTRPEIIKMAPLIVELMRRDADFRVVNTQQHYDYEMSKSFLDVFNLPDSDYSLGVKSGTHAEQTSKAMIGIENVIQKEKPKIVVAEGDTNSVLAAGIASAKMRTPFGHVEAGLRSFDRIMPEEVNRVIVDHCSELLFAPSPLAVKHLKDEGIQDGVFMTGNTVVDAVKQLEPKLNTNILENLSLEKQGYVLVTAHRSENVDIEENCRNIVAAITSLEYPVAYPIHPRTLNFFQRFGLLDKLKQSKNVKLTKPLGYFDFLSLLKYSKLVLTDSGGLQEEAVLLHVPCITMRNNTERQETVESGANILVGTDKNRIVSTVNSILSNSKLDAKMRSVDSPYGDGTAGEQIVAILEDQVTHGLKVRSSNFIQGAPTPRRKA